MSTIHYGTGTAGQAYCGSRTVFVATGDVRTVTCEPCRESPAWLEADEVIRDAAEMAEGSNTDPDVIAFLRRILVTGQAEKWKGTVVDTFSASAVIAVYDRCNDRNRAKLAGMPILQLVTVAFKLLERANAE